MSIGIRPGTAFQPDIQTGRGNDPVVEALLRQLLDHVHARDAPRNHNTSDQPPERVIDVCVDGSCYLLTRTPLQSPRPQPQPQPTAIPLSPRETEIIRLVANGLPTKAIADVLGVSFWTVSTHLRRVFGKLDVSSRAEMIARVLEHGLLARSDIATPRPAEIADGEDEYACERDLPRATTRPTPAASAAHPWRTGASSVPGPDRERGRRGA